MIQYLLILALIFGFDIFINEYLVVSDLFFIPLVVYSFFKNSIDKKTFYRIIFISILLFTVAILKPYFSFGLYLSNIIRLFYVFLVYKLLKDSIDLKIFLKSSYFALIILSFNFLIFLIYSKSPLYAVYVYGEYRFIIFYLEPAHYSLVYASLSILLLEYRVITKKSLIIILPILIGVKSFVAVVFSLFILMRYFKKRQLVRYFH